MIKIFKERYFWIIVALITGLGLLIYAADAHVLGWLPYQEEMHLVYMSLERIFFLFIVVIASWRFGFRGGLAVCLTVGLIALPHINNMISSSLPLDLVIELIIIGIVGIVISWLINEYLKGIARLQENYAHLEQRVRDRTAELEKTHGELNKELAERKQVEKELQQSEERYRALVNLSGEVGEAVVMLQDTEQGEGLQTFVSDQWLRITGYSRDELLGTPFFSLLHPKYQGDSLERHRGKMRGESEPEYFEMSVIKKDGTEVPIELTSASTVYQNRRANVAYIQDITKRKQAEATINKLAYHDSLTGLPNRALFTDRINMALANARRNKQILAIMMLDLDDFKNINDTLGHHIGDEVLIAVSIRLKELLRESDTICRIGGDEFMLLLPNITGHRNTVEIKERIQQVLKAPFEIDKHKIHITASIGTSMYPKNGTNAVTLMINADKAMYYSKASKDDRQALKVDINKSPANLSA
mgnify:CR=1 FL=1